MPARRNVELDKRVVALWPEVRGTAAPVQELAKRTGATRITVGRAIKRLIAEGAWPHQDKPGRGGSRRGSGRPMTPPPATPARRRATDATPAAQTAAPELAGLRGALSVLLPAAVFQRFRRFSFERRVPQSRAVAQALEAFLEREGY